VDSETIDELREYDLRIIQPKVGYRFSVDPLLLCRFADPVEGRIIDLGTGSGVMALIMARRSTTSSVVGVEVNHLAAELARRNSILNELDSKVEIISADILDLKQFKVSSFDLVLANPPFRRQGTGKISPHAGRDTARHESTAGLADFLNVAKYLVHPAGRICFIYHVSRLFELCETVERLKLSPLRLQMVHGDRGSEARMFMVELVKGRRGELRILPPCFTRAAKEEAATAEDIPNG
jgi:tRNA1Val (adenine37-N6)-methyltransferase